MNPLRQHNLTPQQTIYSLLFVSFASVFCRLANLPLVIPFLLLFLGLHLFFFQKGQMGLFVKLGLLLTLIVFTTIQFLRYNLPYLYIPVSSVAIITMLLFKDQQLAFLMALASSMVTSLTLGTQLDMMLIFFLGSLVGVYFVRDARTRGQLFGAGIGVGGVQAVASILLFPYAAKVLDKEFLMGFVVPLALNGVIAVGVVLFLLKVFEWLFSEVTNFSLMELSDFNQPLLRRMILEAPGTYHHSLVVSNLSEAAADAIGANGLLARVGAYYHDIGKMEKPEYFTENQIAIGNKHDDIEPSISKLVILNHVRDGIELGKKHKLNPKIIDFIPQHHGTTLMHFFYRRALEEAEDISAIKEENYRYPGPKPQNRETAIVLLADSAEAATRALEDPTPSNVAEVVRKVINNKFIDGQLDESNLTLKEIEIITATFTRILSAMYHSRVHYPEIQNGHTHRNHKSAETDDAPGPQAPEDRSKNS